MSRIFTRFLREADPIRAQQIVDFERSFAGPSRYQVTQNIHPAEEADGDGTAAPYEGSPMGGGGGMGGVGMPPGGAPPGDQMTDMASTPPGTTPGQTGQPGADQENAPPMQETRLREQGALPPNMPQGAQMPPRGPYRAWPAPGSPVGPPQGAPDATPQRPAPSAPRAFDPSGYDDPSTSKSGRVGAVPFNPSQGAPSTVKGIPPNGSTSSEHGLVPNSKSVIQQRTAASPQQGQDPQAPQNPQAPATNWQKDIRNNIPDFDRNTTNTVNTAGGAALGAGVAKDSFAKPSGAAEAPGTRAAVGRTAAIDNAASFGRGVGGVSRMAGMAAPIVAGGMTAANEYQRSGNPYRAGAVGVGTAAGAGLGAGAGSAIGGVMGLAGGPISPVTVPLGAAVGGAIGGYFGGNAGEKAGNWAADKIAPATPAPTPNDSTKQQVTNSAMPRDDFDLFLDELLRIDETSEDIAEAPFDWMNQGNAPRSYAGFQGPQQAPASVVAGGPAAVQNWQRQMQSVGSPAAQAPQARQAPGRAAPVAAAPRMGGGGGMSSNVQALQKQLIDQGFDVGRTGADGIMGRNTFNAVQAAKDKGYSVGRGGLVGPGGDTTNPAGPANKPLPGAGTQGRSPGGGTTYDAPFTPAPVGDEEFSRQRMNSPVIGKSPGGGTTYDAPFTPAAQSTPDRQGIRGETPAFPPARNPAKTGGPLPDAVSGVTKQTTPGPRVPSQVAPRDIPLWTDQGQQSYRLPKDPAHTPTVKTGGPMADQASVTRSASPGTLTPDAVAAPPPAAAAPPPAPPPLSNTNGATAAIPPRTTATESWDMSWKDHLVLNESKRARR